MVPWRTSVSARPSPRQRLSGLILLATGMVGAMQILGTPPAKAFTFNSLNAGSNPFYLTDSASNWSLDGGSTVRCDAPTIEVACVDYTLTTPDQVLLVSPDADDPSAWSTFQFTSTSAALPASNSYVVTFDASINKFGDGQDEINGYYYVSNARYSIDFSNPNTAIVRNGDTLTFSIERTNFTTAADLTITNFSFSEVPSPLPATGAVTAFGYSRRLRRRIKGRCTSASGMPPPAHPAAYLNLSPETLKSIPVSFSYSTLPCVSGSIQCCAKKQANRG